MKQLGYTSLFMFCALMIVVMQDTNIFGTFALFFLMFFCLVRGRLWVCEEPVKRKKKTPTRSTQQNNTRR